MLVLSILIVPLLLAPVMLSLSASQHRAVLTLDWIVWAVFGFELAAKTYLAPLRRRYLVTHWFDVLIVALPILRPLRVARAARVVRAARLFAVFGRVGSTARTVLTRHKLHYAFTAAAFVVVGAAALATALKHGAGGPIDGFGVSLWWALTTVTTVGYGDTYPVTAAGRGVGMFLMFVGVTLFGVLTANIAAFFVESSDTHPDADGSNGEVMEAITELRTALDAIETHVVEIRDDASEVRTRQ